MQMRTIPYIANASAVRPAQSCVSQPQLSSVDMRLGKYFFFKFVYLFESQRSIYLPIIYVRVPGHKSQGWAPDGTLHPVWVFHVGDRPKHCSHHPLPPRVRSNRKLESEAEMGLNLIQELQ